MDSDEKPTDYLHEVTPGALPTVNDEPIVDMAADADIRKIKEKPPKKLSANDRYVLELVKKLEPHLGDLLRQGYLEATLDIGSGVAAAMRSLVYGQTKAITHDVSKFRQQRLIEKDADKIERVVWVPTDEEVNNYHIERTLAEAVHFVNGVSTGPTVQARLKYFQGIDTYIMNGCWRRVKQFFLAMSLLFPSNNQEELVDTLKKLLGPQP